MRILLADDQAKVRSALRLLLEQEPGLSIVGEAAAVKDLLTQVEVACPDLVLLDWELPGLLHENDMLFVLRARCPHLRVIALSGRPEARRAALNAGADAFVSKGDPPERLLAAVHDCRRGNTKASKRVARRKDGEEDGGAGRGLPRLGGHPRLGRPGP